MTPAPHPTMAAQAHSAGPGFGIYVHWPFCLSLCPYCDFNSHVREAVDQHRWRRALLAELDHYAGQTPERPVTSVFFGGGTPSLMAPETVAAVIARVGESWRLAPDAEITLEANPTSVEAGRFAAYRAAGVNRVSLGVQSLNDDALGFLGRRHSAREAIQAVEIAQGCFPRVSFDLIYARPGQTVTDWRAELSQALALGTEHLSVYQLTIEPGTVFHGAWRRGELVPPGEETAAALYEGTQEVLEGAGLPAYEISNHARSGAESRHNLTYWRYGDYAGIGPGAHGRLSLGGQKLATRQHRAPEAWLDAVERAGHATRSASPLSRDQRLAELVMMGLRLREGVARSAFRRELESDPEDLLDAARLSHLREAALVSLDVTGLRATAAGRQRLDGVLDYLLTPVRAAAAN